VAPYIKGEKFGFSQFNPSNKKSMRWTVPVCGIDRAAQHAGGFRRFDADLEGKCGHMLIDQEILSSSPFGRTTQTLVAFHRQHKGPSARFVILKKQQGTARPTEPKCPLVNACACRGFFCDSQGDLNMQRNRQKDQRCSMGGGGGAPRVPSSRGLAARA
jgi:hypothetical protein